MGSNVKYKYPSSELDYGLDWSRWLQSNESISSSDWEIPDGLTKLSEGVTSTKTSVWISGGVVDEQYELVNSIETDSTPSRKNIAKLYIVIKEE